jgi:hypothetical protein
LSREDSVKKGQIAHLDGNRDNNGFENLAFLCFEHHDEFDSSTSQSKGLQKAEVEKYREELYYHFGNWSAHLRRDELLSFLASQIDLDTLVDGAIKAAGRVVFYAESHAFDVLITNEVDYCDGDLYLPHIAVLDQFAAWGWLTFSTEEREVEDDDMSRVFIKVQRLPVCDEVAARLLERCTERPKDRDFLQSIAKSREWKSSMDNDAGAPPNFSPERTRGG